MKKILRYILIAALTFGAFAVMHEMATAERGFQALGGELAAFMIPLFFWIAPGKKETVAEEQQ